ncbi:MAG TPA: electron transfer flavoprotein subunit alpha/FixB family protein, partial [Thermoanaerobaculia bacterium]|nr:electron transfer flavoprotein subunit alpha/FixB family protein [Thermoanaerobaculia bacterium]
MGKKIWAVAQQRAGELNRMSWEAIVAAQKLARLLDGEVEVVVLGEGDPVKSVTSDLARASVQCVRTADHPALASYTPGAYVGLFRSAIEKALPGLIILPHTYQSIDFMARLAQESGFALVPEVTEAGLEDGRLALRRPIMGGKLSAKVAIKDGSSAILSVQSGAFAAADLEEGDGAPSEALEFDAAAVSPDREILGVEEVGGEQVDLSQASVIVAVGRGVGGADKMAPVEELAQALGAEIGASRPVIDNGWLPRDRQIGSSGQTVAPKLYIALGISGAIQHLVGMKGSQV